ncbi:glycosyltransferase family 4 protein [archaeon]|nr:glycosyltransferase family 4 protein [archaeon]
MKKKLRVNVNKKIKVYMQFPWRFCDSNYYKHLLDCPPEGIQYFSKVKSPGNTINLGKLKINNWIKHNVKKIIKKIDASLPNAHLTRASQKYDLIHCAHCLSLNRVPWIADIEHVGQFWAAPSKKNLNKKRIRKILNSPYCKKILVWSEWGKNKTLKSFPELKSKIDVLHYAIPPQERKKGGGDKIIITFISRRFYFKGGLHAVEIMDRLTKKYSNVEGLVVSDTPKKVLDRYVKNKKIIFSGLQPYDKIMKDVFPKTNIFLYPSYTDTYGFLMVESLAFGVPVVTVEGQCRREIINDGKTGYVVPLPENWNCDLMYKFEGSSVVLGEMEKRVEVLIKNKKLLKMMSREGIREIKEGKFSLKNNNKKLTRIYEEALGR